MKYTTTVLSAVLAGILTACGTTIIVYDSTGAQDDASPGSFPGAGVDMPTTGVSAGYGTTSNTSSGVVPTAGMVESSTSEGTSTSADTSGDSADSSESGSESTAGPQWPQDDLPMYDCGNWLIEPGEACDDGPHARWLDGCQNCERTALFAFVTSPVYEGGSLTLEWADKECSALGAQLGFPAMTWRAWVSDGEEDSAMKRIGSTTLPYILLSQGGHPYPLVKESQQFASGELLTPFNRDEIGAKVGGPDVSCDDPDTLVWTWTTAQGGTSDSCENNVQGTVGSVNDMGMGWTELCTISCAKSAHIYCVEHGPD